MDQEVKRRTRRSYSSEYKAEAVAACRKPGASTAAEALKRSMNANVLRRWVVEADRAEVSSPKAILAPPGVPAKESFVALPMPVEAGDNTPITVEVRRGTTTVSIQWPRSTIQECTLWLRDVLK
jgi:transposase